jgi:transposase
MGKPKAATAAAHRLARLIYTLLINGQASTDQGQDHCEERYREGARQALSRCAAELGMQSVAIAQSG